MALGHGVLKPAADTFFTHIPSRCCGSECDFVLEDTSNSLGWTQGESGALLCMLFVRDGYQIKLDRSLEWIKLHPNATNHDVPPGLRKQWMLDPEGAGQSDLPFTVFVFGYCRARLLTAHSAPLKVGSFEMLENFQWWQLKLGLSSLNDTAKIKSDPLPLFLFSNDENVHFWAE